ncbi:MAG: fatty acid desaturase [Bacteroidetes bacterium]|nr:fatty acid desaturase [Bacteroidota bacterium]
MLRYQADIRSIVFIIIITALLVVLWQWGLQLESIYFWPLYALQLLMAVTVAVMTHNHQHLSMWRNKALNFITDNWLTVFYGFPIFAWIPTHNINHHVHINKEEDYTKTYRYSEKNNLLTLLIYPSVSGYYQQPAVGAYLRGLWAENRNKFYSTAFQIVSLVLWTGIALIIDWQKALLFVVIPGQVSVYTVHVFNYLQHIHCDEESKFNNSRNFTGAILNFLLINNGYHTAHHISTGLHWSQLPEKHKELSPKIDPSLNENDFGWFMLRNYVLGIAFPSFRTKSMRSGREKLALATS